MDTPHPRYRPLTNETAGSTDVEAARDSAQVLDDAFLPVPWQLSGEDAARVASALLFYARAWADGEHDESIPDDRLQRDGGRIATAILEDLVPARVKLAAEPNWSALYETG